MTKSIETMWKEGFLNEKQLSVPQINDLYNRKSQNIVDKLQSMFAINIRAIIGGSVLMLIFLSVVGAPLLGVYVCCLLIPLIVIAQKELKKSIVLSKGQSSYDYLLSFNQWLNSSIATYSRYYKVFYPLLFIGMAIQGVTSNAGEKLIALLLQTFPTALLIFNQPYYLWIGILVIFLIVMKYADAIYRFDLNIIYGRQIKKLQELIRDMEELRQPV